MNSPIFTAFYTRGTRYEAEADRLKRSLDRLSLPHDVRAIDDLGGWQANSQYTATHCCTMLAEYKDRPVVQLDADAVVWVPPVLFDTLKCDVAVHYRRDPQGEELLNGTIYFAPTKAARAVAEKYRQLVADNPSHPSEQVMLARALEELKGKVKVQRLPAGYCWVHDVMREDLAPGEEVVIEHLQASRHHFNSPALPNRMKRLSEIGG